MKKTKLRILAGAVLGIGLAGALFFGVFQIRHIQVEGNTRYTKDEIKEMIADDPWMFNTVLLTTFHSKVDMGDVPFLNSVEYSLVNYDTIRVSVNEKKVVGYVEFENQKVYFDKNGIVLECVGEEQDTSDGGTDAAADDGALSSESISDGTQSSSTTESASETADASKADGSQSSSADGALTADTIKSARVTVADFQPTLDDVPLVTGLTFDHVTVNEQLPVANPAIFRTMLALTRMTEKYKITPESVEFTEDSEIILHYYGTVRVLLGKDSALEEKMTRVAAILPSLSGLSGELHMEDYKEGDGSFVFSKDVETPSAGDAAQNADQIAAAENTSDGENTGENSSGNDGTDGETSGDGQADETDGSLDGTADEADGTSADDTQDTGTYDATEDTAYDATDDAAYGDDPYDDGSDTADENYDENTDAWE